MRGSPTSRDRDCRARRGCPRRCRAAPMTSANLAAGNIMKCTGVSWRDSSPGRSRKPAPGMWPGLVVGVSRFGMIGHALAGLGRAQIGRAFEDPQIRLVQMRREPRGRHQRVGIAVSTMRLSSSAGCSVACHLRHGHDKGPSREGGSGGRQPDGGRARDGAQRQAAAGLQLRGQHGARRQGAGQSLRRRGRRGPQPALPGADRELPGARSRRASRCSSAAPRKRRCSRRPAPSSARTRRSPTPTSASAPAGPKRDRRRCPRSRPCSPRRRSRCRRRHR